METGRYHLKIDIAKCNENGGDKEKIEAFVRDVADKIKMTILGGPWILEGVEANPGYTGLTVVDKSHISVHVFDLTSGTREAMVDIFSCEPYDQEVAIETTRNFLEGGDSRITTHEIWWGTDEYIEKLGDTGDRFKVLEKREKAQA